MVARAAACRLVGVFNGIHPLTVLLRQRLGRAAAWYLARDEGEGYVPIRLQPACRHMARQRGADLTGLESAWV